MVKLKIINTNIMAYENKISIIATLVLSDNVIHGLQNVL